METFFNILLSGILLGGIYSLVSIGLGRPSSDRQAAVLLLRSVAVAA